MRVLGRVMTIFLCLFFLPALASAGWWAFSDRPAGWRQADWGSSGLFAPAEKMTDAVVYVMAARTGGLKGALSLHSWIVIKRRGGAYERFDKVGWGAPVRKNEFPPDGRWYSNQPFFVAKIEGARAEVLVPRVEAAIANYPHSNRGGYRIWPGPNSNSFVAHVLRAVPEIGAVLPSNAVGRDYLSGGRLFAADIDGRDIHASLYGLIGLAAGVRSGLELNFLGLVAGIDIIRPAVKLPGFGRIGLWPQL